MRVRLKMDPWIVWRYLNDANILDSVQRTIMILSRRRATSEKPEWAKMKSNGLLIQHGHKGRLLLRLKRRGRIS
jgi:hypothetical protein